MSYLQKQMDLLRFDKRLLEINMKSGELTPDQYTQYLNNLSDLENNAEKLDLAEDSDSMNDPSSGESSHTPADANNHEHQATTPPNTDPFGSGF